MTNSDILETITPGFIGAGKMGGAIIRGFLAAHPEKKIQVYEKSPEAKQKLSTFKNIYFTETLQELEKKSDTVILCVKPQDMSSVLSQMEGSRQYISIAAGISISSIQNHLQQSKLISRAMPNVAAEIGLSVTGFYCADKNLSKITQEIFSCLGSVFKLDREEQIHAVTALAGSGPAYVFSMIHAMAEGGVLCGLPYELSLEMAIKTIQGSASLLLHTGNHPSAMRNSVTSPGGTTITGLSVLESGGFHGLIMEAVEAASEKSKSLQSI